MGAFDDATAMLSRLLCPGTPSNVFTWPSAVSDRDRTTAGAGVCPSLSDAARVIRGAIVGAAVDATEIVLVRLWPGTFANVSAWRSFVTGARGVLCAFSIGWPARSAAAFVMRGTMVGLSCDAGRGRALNAGLPFAFSRLVLSPLSVDGFVTLDGA